MSRTSVLSNDIFPNPELPTILRRYIDRGLSGVPVREELLKKLTEVRESTTADLILDLGCGTADSSISLAKQHPDCFVLGVDKSKVRLAKAQVKIDRAGLTNLQLFKARFSEFLAGAQRVGLRFSKTYLLYPNPWPKRGQVKRRIYASPELVTLLKLSRSIELRTNWQDFASEFGRSVAYILARPQVLSPQPLAFQEKPLSAFEAKYQARGEDLWVVSEVPPEFP